MGLSSTEKLLLLISMPILVGWITSLFLHFYYSIRYEWYVIKQYSDRPELKMFLQTSLKDKLNNILNGINVEDDIALSLWRKSWVAGSFLLFFSVVMIALLVFALSF